LPEDADVCPRCGAAVIYAVMRPNGPPAESVPMVSPAQPVPVPGPRRRSPIQNLVIIVGVVALVAVTYLLLTRTTAEPGVAPRANEPPAGQVWFGSAFDSTTLEVRGKMSTVTRGQPVALVAHFSRTVPKGIAVRVVVTRPDGRSATVGTQTFAADADRFGVVIQSALLDTTGGFSFEVKDVGGNRLASGSLQVAQ
jgi:hypothetical protein